MPTEKKEILIARWGQQQYSEWLAHRNENIRRKKQGLPPLPAFVPKPLIPPNDMEIIMEVKMAFNDPNDIIRYAGKLQKELQRWWRAETGRTDFILVVDGVARSKKNKVVKLTIDLTQLAMSDEIQDKFKWGATQFVRDYMNKNENDTI